eukprot:1154457-Pelagomonas_calceolata.AAC.3
MLALTRNAMHADSREQEDGSVCEPSGRRNEGRGKTKEWKLEQQIVRPKGQVRPCPWIVEKVLSSMSLQPCKDAQMLV